MKGLITRNLHVKYESPTTYGSRDIGNVKVFPQTDRQTEGQTDWPKTRWPQIFDYGGIKIES